MGIATLNNTGAVAFTATLQHDGVITTENDNGVWLFEDSGQTLLAQTGSGDVPGIGNATFEALEKASLSETGGVVISGTLATGANGITAANNRGLWRYAAGGNSLHARTGAGEVPGILNANFSGFPGATDFALADDGQFSVAGRLALGAGGVLSSNDRGLWSFSSTASTLVTREGSLNVPGVPNASFKNFTLPTVNSNNQLAIFSSLQTGGSVTGSDSLGIWRYTGTNGELLARSGIGNVPGVSGADFVGFDSPRMNDSGQVAFQAQVSTGGKGIWLDTDNVGSLLALSGSGNVPELPTASFSELGVTSINDAGQVLVAAELETGVGGTTTDNDQGLWLLGNNAIGNNASLIARTGSGNVPGVPNADFASFQTSALNANGQVAFAADLQTSEAGIWIVDPLGDSWLVAREGDLLVGRTVASLAFAGDGAGQTGGFNDAGELVFHALFTNGDSGLFLFRPYAADFDRDADVDVDDLTVWQNAFAATPAADADNDGDTEGADFLVWQREFGSGVISTPILTEVPEPASWGLLILGGLFFFCHHKCCSRNS